MVSKSGDFETLSQSSCPMSSILRHYHDVLMVEMQKHLTAKRPFYNMFVYALQ